MHREYDRTAVPFSGRGTRNPLVRLLAVLLASASVMGGECDPKGPDFFDPIGPGQGDIVGEVTVDGVGRSGVTVTLTRNGQPIRTTTTFGNGAYEFLVLDPGDYTVSISSISGAQCPGPQTANVPSGGRAVVDFPCTSLPTTGTVTGRVFDEDGGGGIAGAEVALNGRTTTTDSNGTFTFEDVDSGTQTVQATVTAFQCPVRTTNVTAGQTSSVEIPCNRTHPTAEQIGQRGYKLMGTIQGTDGCGIGSTISNPGPITIRIEVIDGETFIIIESDAEMVGKYLITQLWVGTGTITFTSGGTTFELRETTEGLWTLSNGAVILTGTLEFLVTTGGSEVCRSLYDVVYEQLATSSARFKLDVRPLLPVGMAPFGLRPVTFRYRSPWGDPAEVRVGLLAEDVAGRFPAAVGYDERGRPEGIYYLTLRQRVVEEAGARVARAVDAAIARVAGAL